MFLNTHPALGDAFKLSLEIQQHVMGGNRPAYTCSW
jgi:hypothetical protein